MVEGPVGSEIEIDRATEERAGAGLILKAALAAVVVVGVFLIWVDADGEMDGRGGKGLLLEDDGAGDAFFAEDAVAKGGIAVEAEEARHIASFDHEGEVFDELMLEARLVALAEEAGLGVEFQFDAGEVEEDGVVGGFDILARQLVRRSVSLAPVDLCPGSPAFLVFRDSPLHP